VRKLGLRFVDSLVYDDSRIMQRNSLAYYIHACCPETPSGPNSSEVASSNEINELRLG
jgi:hypothetical protein